MKTEEDWDDKIWHDEKGWHLNADLSDPEPFFREMDCYRFGDDDDEEDSDWVVTMPTRKLACVVLLALRRAYQTGYSDAEAILEEVAT